ncbi:MAG: hypothetical protein QOH84_2782 [Kribbellaceae bacterium]|jgi:hypothetical protein|nr:hypothetical protein [Kribbellaceae bacterium]
MAYSGTIRKFLISCPGDVPASDLALIHRTINRWNGVYGEQFATSVVPISWGEHAAAEFGKPPQAALNDQLVDRCDGCIAIFANRLGTPTESAESGTAEEIQRLAEAGKYVAILRSRRPVDASKLDNDQAGKLRDYLDKIKNKALILGYAENEELTQHIENILAQAVTRDASRAELQVSTGRSAEVWPRVESSERVRTDSKGRTSSSRTWKLVLANTGDDPARDVRFEVDDDSWQVEHGRYEPTDPDIPILAPGGDASFTIFVSMGTEPQTQCTVTWDDDRGPQSNTATLRL